MNTENSLLTLRKLNQKNRYKHIYSRKQTFVFERGSRWQTQDAKLNAKIGYDENGCPQLSASPSTESGCPLVPAESLILMP